MEITNEQMQTIQEVINRISPKYKFGYYELDDIKQEAYIMALEAMEKYDGLRPLENFISKHLSNRLKTLKRDKYFRLNLINPKLNEDKRMLMDLSSQYKDVHYYEENFEQILSSQDLVDKVLRELPPDLRRDFHRLAQGADLQYYRKKAVYVAVKGILHEDW